MIRRLVLTSAALALCASAASATWVPRILDPVAFPNARCNDNSLAVYWVRLADPAQGATEKDQRRWHVHLRGGKSCYDLNNPGPDTCIHRVNNTHRNMTSGCFNPTADPASCYIGNPPGNNGIFDPDEVDNPLFNNFNQVYIPYCSSDQHNGSTHPEPVPLPANAPPPTQRIRFPAADGHLHWSYVDESGDALIRFNGHDILYAVLDDLMNRGELEPINEPGVGRTRVVLSGSSAGVAGVRSQLDRVASYLQPAEVVGLTDAAMYLSGRPPAQNSAGDWEVYCESSFENPSPVFSMSPTGVGRIKYNLWNAADAMDETCVAARPDPTDCFKPVTLLAGDANDGAFGSGFIETPLIAWSNQLDKLPFNTFSDEVDNLPGNVVFVSNPPLGITTKKQCFAHQIRSALSLSLSYSTGLEAVIGYCGPASLHVGMQKQAHWNGSTDNIPRAGQPDLSITYREAVEAWLVEGVNGATLAGTGGELIDPLCHLP